MVIRPYPIRISNVTKNNDFIYSGKIGNSAPLTWSNINYASLYGGYAFPGNIEEYLNEKKAKKKLKEMLSRCDKKYLIQLFGPNYKKYDYENLTSIQYIELERLMHKTLGQSAYYSEILDLPYSNYLIDLSEQTTVTKMERRVFDIDINQLTQNCKINTPYGLYLNFVHHLNCELQGEKGEFNSYHFDRYLKEYFSWLECMTNTEILALGTGAKNGERILRKELIKKQSII